MIASHPFSTQRTIAMMKRLLLASALCSLATSVLAADDADVAKGAAGPVRPSRLGDGNPFDGDPYGPDRTGIPQNSSSWGLSRTGGETT